MAGPYGIDDAATTYGGSEITSYITKTFPSLDQQNEIEEHTPEGASVAQSLFTGLSDYGEIPVSGPYTTEMDAIIGAAARAKTYATLVQTWGGTKTTTITQVGVKNYKRSVAKGAVTDYEATFFVGFGATVTEA